MLPLGAKEPESPKLTQASPTLPAQVAGTRLPPPHPEASEPGFWEHIVHTEP